MERRSALGSPHLRAGAVGSGGGRQSNPPAAESGERGPHGGGGQAAAAAAVREPAQRPVADRSRHPAGVARGLRRRAPPRRRGFAEEVC